MKAQFSMSSYGTTSLLDIWFSSVPVYIGMIKVKRDFRMNEVRTGQQVFKLLDCYMMTLSFQLLNACHFSK
jgi:hypothetical protein